MTKISNLICIKDFGMFSIYQQARENVFQLGANSRATRKLGADKIKILAKFSFELIFLYAFASELGDDQSVCRYTFSRA